MKQGLVAIAVVCWAALGAAQAPAGRPVPPLKAGTFEWDPERATSGPVVVIVSLPDQQAYVYRNGIGIGRTSVSSGRPGHATPTGVFTILQKDKDHRSSIYDDAPMPYMERLTWTGVALHAGNLPGYPASHGCIRLPLEFAKLLFGVTSRTTTVVVADRLTADEHTLHPGLLLASANLEENAAVSSLPEPGGQAEWTPEKSPSGPISILLSGADRTIYVYRNGVLIGRAAVSIVDPERPLAPGVFVALEGTEDAPDRLAPGRPNRRWQAASLPKENGELAGHDAFDRVRIPQPFGRQVYDVLEPGTTLMVTDRTATGFTTTPADFTVMATEMPAPPPKR